MRTRSEMMNLILSYAQTNKHIRALYQCGSMVNPHITQDRFQDFDIVYVVDDLDIFRNPKWLAYFGDILLLSDPNQNDTAFGFPVDTTDSFTYLVMFEDTNRIDVTVQSIAEATRVCGRSSLTKILLDKDHILPHLQNPNDSSYHIKEPSVDQINACTNEFLWQALNVTKSCARNELPLAFFYIDLMREQLHHVLDWYVLTTSNIPCASGKHGKFYHQILPKSLYQKYLCTYSHATQAELWNALLTMMQLFYDCMLQVDKNHSFFSAYARVMDYISEIKESTVITHLNI